MSSVLCQVMHVFSGSEWESNALCPFGIRIKCIFVVYDFGLTSAGCLILAW